MNLPEQAPVRRAPPGSLLVAIPSIGMVHSEAYESMLLAFSAAVQYWGQRHPLSEVALRVVHRKPADNARNILAWTAMEGGFDWIWWVDDDNEIPENALPILHGYNQPMASALYGTKEYPSRPLIFCKYKPDGDDQKDGWRHLELDPEKVKGRAWIDGTGLGCFLMKREVLQYVWEKTNGEPFRWSMECTDDIYFFKVTNAAGMKILIDMDLRLGHWGLHNYRIKEAKHEEEVQAQEAVQVG